MVNRTNLTEIKKGQEGCGLLIEQDGYISLSDEKNRVLRESIESYTNGDVNALPRPFVVSAVFQKFGIENANGRIYPEKILKREVEKYMAAVRERRAYGECNHPDTSQIDLDRIAMNITNLYWQGHTLLGEMEIPITEGFRKFGMCSTVADRVAQLLISKLRIGVSSRGLGTVTQQMGKLVVGDDYEILCWDVVSNPSTPGAWIDENPKELQKFVESVEPTNNNIIKEDKFSKFDNWLLS